MIALNRATLSAKRYTAALVCVSISVSAAVSARRVTGKRRQLFSLMVITGGGIRQWPPGQGDISSGRIDLMRYIWLHACASKGCETLEVSRIFILERLFGPGDIQTVFCCYVC